MNPKTQVQRYSDSERVNHWIVAIAFILAGLSGLSMFHPALFWLSNLFGGGPWTRILHPFIGVVMFAAFLSMMLRFWNYNKIEDRDWRWLKQWRDVVNNREDKLPEVGRYNAGQKVLFWLMVICTVTLFVTGVLFWRPWFADYFPITLVRLATLLHSAAATVLIIGIIVHIYAAIWIKGSIRAMMRGTVSAKWAAKHHRAWLREKTKQG
ncbi:MAG: formate dehydrogenase subunit gamma [Betaproteobacteria bacterium]|nr:formate dehydrogenase subunit gamma [Betaproteobacteria bacterium]